MKYDKCYVRVLKGGGPIGELGGVIGYAVAGEGLLSIAYYKLYIPAFKHPYRHIHKDYIEAATEEEFIMYNATAILE